MWHNFFFVCLHFSCVSAAISTHTIWFSLNQEPWFGNSTAIFSVQVLQKVLHSTYNCQLHKCAVMDKIKWAIGAFTTPGKLCFVGSFFVFLLKGQYKFWLTLVGCSDKNAKIDNALHSLSVKTGFFALYTFPHYCGVIHLKWQNKTGGACRCFFWRGQ